MIKILITDDSKFMRVSLERILQDDSEIQVVGTARNGIEALEFLKDHPVDVVILDFFMPKMDGLETLKNIMQTNPIPTIMITIANEKDNADLYFKALKSGAFDIIPKPSGLDSLYIDQMRDNLKEKIRIAAQSKVKLKSLPPIPELFEVQKKEIPKSELVIERSVVKSETSGFSPSFDLLIIGASTGGPSKVFELIKGLPYRSNLAIIIVQHMPSGFTEFFAQRLGDATSFKFTEAKHMEKLRPGVGYVAPGNFHLRLALNNFDINLLLDQNEKIWGVRPCIDVTMKSAAPIFKDHCVGVILTGMGQDGSEGIQEIKRFRGRTYAQSADEALINSMPDHAIKTGAIDYIFPVEKISRSLSEIIKF